MMLLANELVLPELDHQQTVNPGKIMHYSDNYRIS